MEIIVVALLVGVVIAIIAGIRLTSLLSGQKKFATNEYKRGKAENRVIADVHQEHGRQNARTGQNSTPRVNKSKPQPPAVKRKNYSSSSTDSGYASPVFFMDDNKPSPSHHHDSSSYGDSGSSSSSDGGGGGD